MYISINTLKRYNIYNYSNFIINKIFKGHKSITTIEFMKAEIPVSNKIRILSNIISSRKMKRMINEYYPDHGINEKNIRSLFRKVFMKKREQCTTFSSWLLESYKQSDFIKKYLE
jgi:hypothetical protein